MKTVILLMAMALLAGCKTTPVVTPFPKPPEELMVRPPDLNLIPVRTIQAPAAKPATPSK